MLQFVTSDGVSPSGKALVSGTSIRGFESLHPSHEKRLRSFDLSLFSFALRWDIQIRECTFGGENYPTVV